MIQIDVGGLTYGASNMTTEGNDGADDVKTTTTRYGTTGTVIKVGAIDEHKFLRYELNIPGAQTSDKFIRGGYAVMPNSLYLTLGLGSKNVSVTTDESGDDVTTNIVKSTDFAVGLRWLKYMDKSTLDFEFNFDYGVVGKSSTPGNGSTSMLFDFQFDYYYSLSERALVGAGVGLGYDMKTAEKERRKFKRLQLGNRT